MIRRCGILHPLLRRASHTVPHGKRVIQQHMHMGMHMEE